MPKTNNTTNNNKPIKQAPHQQQNDVKTVNSNNPDNKNTNNVGALWERKDNFGNIYMTGSLKVNEETINIFVNRNRYKKENKHPDWTIKLNTGLSNNSMKKKEIDDNDIPDDDGGF